MPIHDIEEIENVFIEMKDGCQLAARLFIPVSAWKQPVPVILEYLPYRKRDLMRSRDESLHRYFAAQGYACARVDVRGSGDSQGVMVDEYSAHELDDALRIIEWLCQQSWCNGNVGMMGISWGGFNALQVAALNPPALKAIITLCASDDRYADDAHYMGGCLLNENMQWGSILTLYGAYPPDPEIVGDQWRQIWLKRLEKLQPFPALWMQHPWRDDFWKHGSVCENYQAIKIPVYIIGGWADGYTNSVSRLLENLNCPRKGLIGPWAHTFPQDGIPGPAIGFLQEAVRWWDHWLKNIENGMMKEPLFRVWMQDTVKPMPQYDVRPGRWVAEKTWPSTRIKYHRFYLGVGHMGARVGAKYPLSFTSPTITGLRAGEWCGFGVNGETPGDQRQDDGGSLVFDSDPLRKPLEILGGPTVTLHLQSDSEVAMVAVRLCDVAPDGSSLRVTYGILNLTHRDSHEFPQPLVPGETYSVTIKLNDIAHSFPQGHRLRLAISTCYWPIAWPVSTAVTLTVHTAESFLDLPVRPKHRLDKKLRDFAEPVAATGSERKKLVHLPMRRTIEMDLSTNEVVYTLKSDGGELDGAALVRMEEINLEIGYQMLKRYRMIEDDPISAQTEIFQRTEFHRDGWKIRLVFRSKMSATAQYFQYSGDLEAFENDRLVKEHNWVISIPRKFL